KPSDRWTQRTGHGDDFLHTVRPAWRDADRGAFRAHAITRLMERDGNCPNGADIARLRLRIDEQCEESCCADGAPDRCQLPAFVYPPIIAIAPFDAPSRTLQRRLQIGFVRLSHPFTNNTSESGTTVQTRVYLTPPISSPVIVAFFMVVVDGLFATFATLMAVLFFMVDAAALGVAGYRGRRLRSSCTKPQRPARCRGAASHDACACPRLRAGRRDPRAWRHSRSRHSHEP